MELYTEFRNIPAEIGDITVRLIWQGTPGRDRHISRLIYPSFINTVASAHEIEILNIHCIYKDRDLNFVVNKP